MKFDSPVAVNANHPQEEGRGSNLNSESIREQAI